jgi:DMSO reductase family type II enzyme heme b subunit
MRHLFKWVFWIFLLPPLTLVPFARYEDDVLKKSKTPDSEEIRKLGAAVYKKHCSFCHGDQGKGDGLLADYVFPRPRDLTRHNFKFRITNTGELPTDEDLFRTLSLGVPGTVMPAFGEAASELPERERWAVVYYIKTFNRDFADPDFNPYKNLPRLGEPPGASDQLRKRGAEVFQTDTGGGCYKCHGNQGRGNGKEAGTHKDDPGYLVLPADLTKGWRYKNWGHSPKDIFRAVSLGLNGTPMPGYDGAIESQDRWAVTYFVTSLIEPEGTGSETVLRSQYRRGDLPTDPKDPRWDKAPPLDIPLIGQLVAPPRLLNPSVDQIRVRSLYNDGEIAFLLVWNDRFKNATHQPPPPLTEAQLRDTYVKVDYDALAKGTCRDGAALQFPVAWWEGRPKPYFFLGGSDQPVTLWWWKADWQEDLNNHNGTGVEEINAQGFFASYMPRPSESQNTKSHALFDDGQWRVVLIRSLTPSDPQNDVQFKSGARLPVAFHVWDGANNEQGLQRSISPWYYVQLEAPTPWRAYLFGLLAALVVGMLELFFTRRFMRRGAHKNS